MGDSVLAELWSHVENNWENPTAHQALLQHCARPEQLAEVARRYRSAMATAGTEEIARRQLRQIAAVAMAQLEVRREPKESRSSLGKLILAALFLLGSAILASLL